MQTAAIIGGAGFIGSYVTKVFLKNGYKARVSATDITNKSKYEHLLGLANAENLKIFAADMRGFASIEKFVSGCDIVIHGGTPFMLDVKDLLMMNDLWIRRNTDLGRSPSKFENVMFGRYVF